jgi:type IV pilus assembly protein PilM
MTATIGLDIGTSAVRAALLQSGKRGVPTLRRYGEVALPQGAVEGGEIIDPVIVEDAIRRLWKSTKLPKKGVVLGLANPRIVVRRVELPRVSDEALKAGLAQHVQEFIPMSPEDAVLDFLPVEETDPDSQTRPVLVVAAHREMVDQFLSVAEAAGLKVDGVDLQAFALVRAVFGAQIPVGEAPKALISLGAGLTQVVVTQDGVLQFLRLIPIGGNHFTKSLVTALGISQEEAEELKRSTGVLADPDDTSDGNSVEERAVRVLTEEATSLIDEIRGSIEFSTAQIGGDPVSEIKISGNAARMPHLAARMARMLDIPVTPVKLLGDSVEVGKTGLSEDQLSQAQPVLPVVVGLAEWGLS